MRPITLEIEGLRSFRSRQVIDFSGRDHLAIIGDTGAGKSSILEALTFALYGRVTFSGRGHQELVNATSPSMRVVLHFDVGGERWEVARVLRRTGAGDIGGAQATLRRLDAAGEPVEVFERVREVNAKVEEVLGLDAEAFLRTVVLPQGQFSRLLVDDDGPARSAVLAQIWR
ncbi:MAG: SMC family ATPase, partial [Actinomycetota bacterium]|nr:SMC family ATPase [Actinomycetota bacterium]